MGKVNRVERHVINKKHVLYEIIDNYCYKSKNLYNYANYLIRNEFIENGKYIKYPDSSKMLKTSEPFMEMGSNSAQMTLRILHKNWLSFFGGMKSYRKCPSNFKGRPNLPRYLKKDGRFVWTLTNVQSKVLNGFLHFTFKPLKKYNSLIRSKVKDKHLQTRFVPKGDHYVLEIVYEKEIVQKDIKVTNERIVGIDLGVGRLASIQNNFNIKPIAINGGRIKAVNNYYNKLIAKYKSIAMKINNLQSTERTQKITTKRNHIMDNFMHKATRYIVNYCLVYDVDTVVIGYNSGWKQRINLGKQTQHFVVIPFQSFVSKLEYKLQEKGIKLIKTEESYTSKASFIDNDLPQKGIHSGKRVHRGLYKSKNGIHINADINGASNIIKKVFPNAFDGIKGVHFHPTIINL